MAFQVVSFQGRQQAGLGEGGFAAAACPGDKQQGLFCAGRGEIGKGCLDCLVPAPEGGPVSIVISAQSQVWIWQAAHVVGGFYVDGDVLIAPDEIAAPRVHIAGDSCPALRVHGLVWIGGSRVAGLGLFDVGIAAFVLWLHEMFEFRIWKRKEPRIYYYK